MVCGGLGRPLHQELQGAGQSAHIFRAEDVRTHGDHFILGYESLLHIPSHLRTKKMCTAEKTILNVLKVVPGRVPANVFSGIFICNVFSLPQTNSLIYPRLLYRL
jgi:hypothetical protein